MSYSTLAVKILNNMSSAGGGEAILPSKLQHHSTESPELQTIGSTMEPAQRKSVTSPNTEQQQQQQQDSKQGVTFANQDSLPKLPIPDLESTCRKYIESLVPLQTPREHEETKASVYDFLKSEGPELQEKLKKYASYKTSYIEQFCRFWLTD
jgi:carnitine O-acetyltransferase